MAFAVEMLEYSIASVKRELERHDRSVPDRVRSVIRQWATSWDEDPEVPWSGCKAIEVDDRCDGCSARQVSSALSSNTNDSSPKARSAARFAPIKKPLHLAEMMEGMLILIAGNWVSGWWEKQIRFAGRSFHERDGCLSGWMQSGEAYQYARLACASRRESHSGKTTPRSLILSRRLRYQSATLMLSSPHRRKTTDRTHREF